MIVGLGLIVVQSDAFTTGGATAMPSPTDDVDAPWLWHQFFVFGPTVAAESATALDQFCTSTSVPPPPKPKGLTIRIYLSSLLGVAHANYTVKYRQLQLQCQLLKRKPGHL